MKQVQIVQNLSPGGIETMALDLKRFCAKPEQTLLVSLEGSTSKLVKKWPRLQPLASNIIGLEKPPGVSLKTLWKLTRLLRKFAPDVVHTHHVGPLLYGGASARLAGCKTLIHTEHDAWHLQSPKRRVLMKNALKVLRPLLVADAQVVADEITQHLGVSPNRIIKNGIDTQRFQPGDSVSARDHFGLGQSQIIVGCAARLIEVKGHEVLLNALRQLPDEVHLAFAGNGVLEDKLRRLTFELGLKDRVHWLGNVEDMPRFYQALDIACLPSYQEGFPLTLLEAQACGIPVVASDTGGVHETLCPDNCRLVEVGDAAGFAKAITEVSSQMDAQRRHSMAWAVRDFVASNNDVRDMVQRYHALATSWGNTSC